jgi:hypothetical protein
MTPLPPTVYLPSRCRVLVIRDAWRHRLPRVTPTHFQMVARATACKRWCQHAPHAYFGKACASQIWRAIPCWASVGCEAGYGN